MSMIADAQDVFHPGERSAQALAGGGPVRAFIRDAMPDEHRLFFGELPMLLAATAGLEGWPMATALAGSPGFVRSPDPRHLHVATALDRSDPALADLREGSAIGLLGIDLATRRRNRANGRVVSVGSRSIEVEVLESFGNCPQYIQARDVEMAPADRGLAGEWEALPTFDEETRTTVRDADTFFVATAGGEESGLDMSHRGGHPGFVRVKGDELTIPDFRGNRYFNTFGNLLLDPRASLLFVDFATGDLLRLQGTATLGWDDPETALVAGAQRLWRLRVTAAWRRRAALPLRWTFREPAPTTLRTGVWPEAASLDAVA